MRRRDRRLSPDSNEDCASPASLLQAAEALLAPEVTRRHWGVQRIQCLGVHRSSPFVAALLARCLCEPEVSLRSVIVQMLAEALSPEEEGRPERENVRAWACGMLNGMRQREIYALVQVAHNSRGSIPAVCRMLEYCPFAGSTLVRIVTNSQGDVEIRAAAAELLGCIGYLDACLMLDGLVARLQRRQEAQPGWSLTPGSREVEILLPAAMAARAALAEAEQ